MNSFEKITQSIIDDAVGYAGTVAKNAREQCERLTGDGASRGAATAAEMLAKGKKECEAVMARAASSADVLERNILLDAKSVLIDEVYEEASKRLSSLPDEKYLPFLNGLLCRAIESIGEEEDDGYGYVSPDANVYTVTLNARDREKFGAALVGSARAKAEEKGCTVVLSPEVAGISGGMLVRRGDVEINASLGMLVKSARERTEGEVLRILFTL